MIRRFDLINSLGETYRLTLADKYGAAFMHDVTGLGAEQDAEFQQIGNRFGLLNDKINQKTITGIIKFFQPRAYENYIRFTLFCQHAPLKIYYRTDAGEFWRDGIVTKIDKSENAESLKATIDFEATSLWYTPYSLEGINTVNILSESKNESGCHITITGTLSAPYWTQSVNGQQIVVGRLENKTGADGGTISPAISAGEKLHIRTDVSPYRIYKTNNMNVETDLYFNSNWNTERFCLIQYGHNVISCPNAVKVEVEGRIEYETV